MDTDRELSSDSDGWDQIWVLRCRSRRDLLDVLLQFDSTGLYYHRVAAIENLEAAVRRMSKALSSYLICII